MPLYTQEEYEELKNALDEIREVMEDYLQDYVYVSYKALPSELRKILNGGE